MSLQVWLPLNGNLNNQGLLGAQITPNNISYISGQFGQGVNFNASANDNYIKVINNQIPNILNSDWTICFWIKSNDTNDRSVYFGTYWTNATNYFSIEKTTTNQLRLVIKLNNTVQDYAFASSILVIDDSNWHHIALVRTSDHLAVYEDGVLKRNKDIIFPMVDSNLTTYYIGNDARLETTAYKGVMNDFRVYDEALSAKQIKEISKGLVLHYALKGAAGGANVLPEGTNQNNDTVKERTATITSTSSAEYSAIYYSASKITYPGTVYTFSFDAKSDVEGTLIHPHFYSSEASYTTTKSAITSQGVTSTAGTGEVPITLSTEWKRYWVTYTQTEDNYNKRVALRLIRPSSGSRTASVRNIKFEKGDRATQYCPPSSNSLYSELDFDSAIEKDLSGFGHDSRTIFTLPDIDTTSPRYCTAYDFTENTVKRVRTQQTHDFDFTDNFTWSCWAKARAKTDTSTGAQYAFSVGRADGAPWGYGLHPNNTGTAWIASFGSISWITVATGVTVNTWHHFAFTKKGTTIKTFMDGELKTESEFSGTLPTYPAQNPGPGIGYFRYYNGTTESIMYPLNGCVSDFRIYATALSDDDIRELYASPASIDNQGNLFTYELNEISREKVDISQNGETHTDMFTVFTDNGAETPSIRATKTSFYEDNKVVSHDFIEY